MGIDYKTLTESFRFKQPREATTWIFFRNQEKIHQFLQAHLGKEPSFQELQDIVFSTREEFFNIKK